MAIDNFCIRFIDKNCVAWEFQFKMFVNGKILWSHVDWKILVPIDNAAIATWQTQDAQIITWILTSIDPLMVNDLLSFSTAVDCRTI